MVRAKVTVKGRLAIVETETGQRAVVPYDSLCDLARRYGLEYEGVDVKCPGLSRTGVGLEEAEEVEEYEPEEED